MIYNNIIFDLDGTILNTMEDLAASLNYTLKKYSMPALSIAQVRLGVGRGISNLVSYGAGAETNPDKLSDMVNTFVDYYRTHSNVHTKPYPGVKDTLKSLKDHGAVLSVNTNKIDSISQELCSYHFPGIFNIVVGESKERPRKPAPDGVEYICSANGSSIKNTIFVGDSNVDMATARNAGIPAVWVSWGFARIDEVTPFDSSLCANTAYELLNILSR